MSNSSVSNNRGSMDSVNHRGGMDSVNHRASDDRSGVNNWAGDHRSVISRSSVSHRMGNHSLGVLGGAIIGHISNIAIIAISVIVDMLDPAIGKSHGVRSLSIAGTVRALRLLEVGLGVVIGHGVGEGVGGGLGQVISNISSLDNRGVVSRGVNNRGDIGGGSIHWGMGGGGSDHKGRDASDDLELSEILDYGEY